MFIKKNYLDKPIAQLNKDFDYNMRDIDIERLLREEEESGTIATLVSQKIIESPRAMKYRKMMKSDTWQALKTKWENLQDAVKEAFEKPVSMRVFAYNDEMEKDTVMTPFDSIKIPPDVFATRFHCGRPFDRSCQGLGWWHQPQVFQI